MENIETYKKLTWILPIIVIALAMGADFVMMGRYFAMTEESPTPRTSINGQMYKPYWGEGTRRAKNWQRYAEDIGSQEMVFEEGVDAYVPLVGGLAEVMSTTLYKLKSKILTRRLIALSIQKADLIFGCMSEKMALNAYKKIL